MLRHYTPYLRKFRSKFLLAIACLIIEDLAEVAIPAVLSFIIDEGIANSDKQNLLTGCAIMFGLSLLSLALGMLYARLIARAGQSFSAEIRKALFAKIQQFSFANLDRFTTSSLITRMTNDIQVLQNVVTNGVRPAVRAPITIIASLVFMLTLNAKLALTYFMIIPILSAGLIFVLKHVRPLYHTMQKTIDRVNLTVQENLTAIQIVKAFTREDYEEAKFAAASMEQRRVTEKSNRFSALNQPIMHFGFYVVVCFTLWRGGILYNNDAVSIGDITAILSYTRQCLNSLLMLSNVFMLITRSTASILRISEVFDEKIDISDEDAQQLTVTHGEIEFDHVSFKYEKQAKEYVLNDITLHIRPGSTVGIIGGTGSSKSSLIQLIPRLYDVTEGTLLIDGKPVQQYPLVGLRDSIAVVLQKNTLFSGTIAENLRWGNHDADPESLCRVCRDACIDSFVESLENGYETVLGQQGAGLSGGQRQRLCIARALLKNPKVLILDDSTSAVDVATEGEIQKNLAAHYPGMTRIIIAQRITSIMNAEQIIILDDGKINAVGTHQELLNSNKIYQEIYHSQLEGALL